MRKALVVHMFKYGLMNLGGGVRVSLSFAKVLKTLGYRVTYCTPCKTDWNLIKKIYSIQTSPDGECIIPKHVFPLKAYQDIVINFLVKLFQKADMVVDTAGTFIPFADIIYIHYPGLLKTVGKNTLLKIYKKPREILLREVGKSFNIILTNSKYSRDAIIKYLKRDAFVLYPPVDVEKYLSLSKVRDRKNIIVTVGRFIPEKRFEALLELAKRKSNITFIIMGTVKGRDELSYYFKIKKGIIKNRLRNVVLKINVPFKEKREILSKAKIYFHAMIGEHFGVSIVEAMAAGCVPIVHKSGGSWIDILNIKQGVHGFAYENLEEAEVLIGEIVNNESLRQEIVETNRTYVKKFSSKVFERKLHSLLSKFL